MPALTGRNRCRLLGEIFANQNPLPRLVLLDLKMPRVDGFDVLCWMQKQPTLKLLPVTVLSSSNEDRDVDRAYALGLASNLRTLTEGWFMA